jgi:branched-subunit amino acid transport protein
MIWVILIISGLLTFLTRLSFIWLFERITVPDLLRRALRFVPPAVLTVFVFQEILLHDGVMNFSPGNARLIAGVIASLVAWRSRSILLTILAGMAALFICQSFLHF